MPSHTLPGRGTAAHRARKLPANGIVTDAELGATADAPASRRDAWCAHRLFAHRCDIRAPRRTAREAFRAAFLGRAA